MDQCRIQLLSQQTGNRQRTDIPADMPIDIAAGQTKIAQTFWDGLPRVIAQQ